ncbi:hypothetical protein JOB18_048590 [Solea senegalensis]|uniref:L1 transposable element RRM domain-containing protein n=1 Tax=Solea senegalensis TaxID=28829 RepID=A0AAV6PHQ8_SOLSE|nr:hypothetical protein JOB18_035246 [Solea senegalensis]KAG7460564.1 hypothetical protein JOB18_048590 [Solea senegalensis]
MSKQTTLKDCESSTRSRGSQRPKTTMVVDDANETGGPRDDLAAVLNELQSLRKTVIEINTKISTLDDFGGKLDNVERRIAEMNGSVDAVQKSFTDLQQDITAYAKRLTEAEGRIGDAENDLQSVNLKLTDAAKRIACLESKTEDLENRARRKNLRLVGLPESAEKTQLMTDYIQRMLPAWLGLDANNSSTLERAHRTLARPRPDQSRAVIIRFLRFQDRELVFNTSKHRSLTHEGHKIFFAQDLSAETMKARSSFNAVKKKFIEAGTFRGFTLRPCKMRALHNGKLIFFSTPEEAENFLPNT